MEEALFEDKIFSIVPKTSRKESNELLSIISGPLEHLLGLRQCTALYEQLRSQSDSHLFMREVLRRLDVQPVVKTEDLENIPRKVRQSSSGTTRSAELKASSWQTLFSAVGRM